MQLECHSHSNLRPWESSHHWTPFPRLFSAMSALHYVPGPYADDIHSGWHKVGTCQVLQMRSARQSNALGNEVRRGLILDTRMQWQPLLPSYSRCPVSTDFSPYCPLRLSGSAPTHLWFL